MRRDATREARPREPMTLPQRRAFEKFIKLGSGRTLSALAQVLPTIKESTLRRWSRQCGWIALARDHADPPTRAEQNARDLSALQRRKAVLCRRLEAETDEPTTARLSAELLAIMSAEGKLLGHDRPEPPDAKVHFDLGISDDELADIIREIERRKRGLPRLDGGHQR